VPRALPAPNPVTGKYSAIPMNTYGVIIRKGMNFAANQAPVVSIARLSWDVPAGADAYSPAEIRAMASLLCGILSQQSSGVGDTLTSGIM